VNAKNLLRLVRITCGYSCCRLTREIGTAPHFLLLTSAFLVCCCAARACGDPAKTRLNLPDPWSDLRTEKAEVTSSGPRLPVSVSACYQADPDRRISDRVYSRSNLPAHPGTRQCRHPGSGVHLQQRSPHGVQRGLQRCMRNLRFLLRNLWM